MWHKVKLSIFYKGKRIETFYRADFICYDSIIIKVKALTQLSGIKESQILNYLKATGLKVGLRLNFGATSLEYKRYANSK